MVLIVVVVVIVMVVVVVVFVVFVVIIVIVIPNVHSVAAVLVAPLNLSLEVRSFTVLVPFNGVVWISSPVTKFPCVWVWNACVSIWVEMES